MKDELVRFGVAMESPLLTAFDAIVAERGGTRSELLRDLVRAEVTKAKVQSSVNAVATLTIVYDHHVRDLTERLTEFQHSLGDRVRSTLHVHLDHDNCLEVIILRGRSDEIRRAAERLIATRGVKHGAVEIIADAVVHGHEHAAGEDPFHSHPHVGDTPRTKSKKRR